MASTPWRDDMNSTASGPACETPPCTGSARGRVLVAGADGPASGSAVRVGALIAERARLDGESLVVMGLEEHARARGVPLDTIAMRVMRRTGVPVLAAAPALDALPRRVVAAVDFTRASLRAARLARALMADGGTMWLACVRRDGAEASRAGSGRRDVVERSVRDALGRLAAELGSAAGITIVPVLLEGSTPAELLALADRVGADLIALGTHRRRQLDGIAIGGVTASIVRDGRYSVLVAPGAHGDRQAPRRTRHGY